MIKDLLQKGDIYKITDDFANKLKFEQRLFLIKEEVVNNLAKGVEKSEFNNINLEEIPEIKNYMSKEGFSVIATKIYLLPTDKNNNVGSKYNIIIERKIKNA